MPLRTGRISSFSPKPGFQGKFSVLWSPPSSNTLAHQIFRYPKGNDAAWIASHIHDYVENSLVIGSPQWKSLLAAAKSNKVYLALGYSERTNSSLYMAQALISPCGEVLHARHKVRPSGGERDIWGDGEMDGLKVIDTPYGRWGLLECWE
jgi:nitrilase